MLTKTTSTFKYEAACLKIVFVERCQLIPEAIRFALVGHCIYLLAQEGRNSPPNTFPLLLSGLKSPHL